MNNGFFRVLSFRVVVEESLDGVHRGRDCSEATIRVEVRQRGTEKIVMHEIADGNGPVHALDRALRKALVTYFPEIEGVKLVDFEVHTLKEDEGAASQVEVAITSSDGTNTWETKGVSTDIIKASLSALAEGLRKEIEHMANSA